MVKIINTDIDPPEPEKLSLFSVKHNNLTVGFDCKGNIYIETKGVWQGDNEILREMMDEVMVMMKGKQNANQ